MVPFLNLGGAFAAVLLFCPLILAQTSSWVDLAPISIGGLQEHSTVAISSTQIVTIGGVVGRNAKTLPTTLLYDIPSNTWKEISPLPIPLNHLNAAVVDGKIYSLGGLESPGGGAVNWRGIPNGWVYDPLTSKWSPLESMPADQARGGSAVGVYNKIIFIAGGLVSLSSPTLSVVTAFDTVNNRWLTLPEPASRLPAAREHVGGAVVDSKFYVVGGRDSGQNNVRDDVFILDLDNLETGWRTSSAKMPTARGGIAAAVIGKKIYTFGGEGNPWDGHGGVFNQTEVYDTEMDMWTSLAPMKHPRHGTSAVGIGEKIYIPGGGTEQGLGASPVFDVFTP
jgi:N-acetylneuraminic acid mutarotase